MKVEEKEKQKRRQKRKRGSVGIRILFFGSVFLLLLMQRGMAWAGKAFGSIHIDEIIFTLNMPLNGTNPEFFLGFLTDAFLPALGITLALLLAYLLYRRLVRRRGAAGTCCIGVRIRTKRFTLKAGRGFVRTVAAVVLLAWFAGLLHTADVNYGLSSYLKYSANPSDFIKEHYVDPNDVQIAFPEQKRNLIYILMESAETSNQDIANGGLFEENYIPEMTQIARENVSFSRSDKLEGATEAPSCGWTIAAMVAQFSGIPLKLRSDANGMGKYKYFLPGVTNLGDLLEKEGYHNYYMVGSDVTFAGRDLFMKQHGNHEIWDYYTAIEKGKIPEDYYVWWGYEDQKLYEYAKEELTRLSQEDEPFAFTMLTVDTHHIGGYVCDLCRNDFADQYANVWACASRQVDAFLRWIQAQPFYENTTVVISGDHWSMDPNFYKQFEEDIQNGVCSRYIYNAIINPAAAPVKENGRFFNAMDMFPTTLAAMGVEIEGDRLGLGTNLFSEQPTLYEEYGEENVNDGLRARSAYFDERFMYQQKPNSD